jgi:excinuclease ABC subunit A
VSRRRPSASPRRSARYRGQTIGLLAPLVVNRKGVYTELADWARRAASRTCAWTASFCPPPAFRASTASRSTPSSCRWEPARHPGNEAQLRESLARAGARQGRGARAARHRRPAPPWRRASTARIGQVEVFSTKRACPVCGTSYAELDPRLFSYNSKHGWCPDCVGTGVKLTREQRKALDDSVLAADEKGREQTFAEVEVEDLTEQPCPTCQGTRLNPVARAVRLPLERGPTASPSPSWPACPSRPAPVVQHA